ncbi:thioredoxin domain-containing protein [Allopontixanthobacter sp.]|uniref:thioredoxin domain-containing protein n=1 Tax=Allopontixanthobacter sp. TaxID=2906452 RepID=UPI002ABB3FB4|nr:thioredoxin domain-containing protein [Allopontixanthobacter sp.]MDZ4307934.1 thioredoxin domain-containing protein [Allopontixanthobacter sp.]
MTTLRRIALLTFSAPLALSLAACGDSATTEGEIAESAPVAKVAAPAGQSWADVATVSEYDGYVMGNPDAPIKLVEYASLTCGACAAFSTEAAEPLRDEYINTGAVSYEIRNQVHNAIDLVLARLVRCGQPESFHPLAEQIWLNLGPLMQQTQANPQALEAAMTLPENQRFAAIGEASGVFDFFAARGLSRDQARTCLADNASVTAIAERSEAQSTEFNVTGTPTFFINGTRVDGTSWNIVEPLLQRAGAR